MSRIYRCLRMPILSTNQLVIGKFLRLKLFQIFNGAKAFNQSIHDWNVSAVKNFYGIFSGLIHSIKIGNWDITSVTTLNRAFHGAHSFNQDISGLGIPLIRDMNQTFMGQRLSIRISVDWNISSVTNFAESFSHADSLLFQSDSTTGRSSFLIHESFSPTDNNQTQPTGPDNNQIDVRGQDIQTVPSTGIATQPPVRMIIKPQPVPKLGQSIVCLRTDGCNLWTPAG